MIGIIGAMDIEVDGIIEKMTDIEKRSISCVDFYKGKIGETDVVIAKAGIGKVNAALCTQTMILTYNPSLVINSGIAGGIGDNVCIGDLVVGVSCVQYDHDTTAIGDPLGTIFTNKGNLINFPCDENYSNIFAEIAKDIYDGTIHKGVVASGDQFLADGKKCLFLNEHFSAIAGEMEGASVCQVCYLNDVPFVVLRSISDNANHSETVDYLTFAKSSAVKLTVLLTKVLPKINFKGE
ncbi:MAG: 5'-methylthioadenosine/adenosylhomocysteine nucleosidase [Clostridia bacterium]